MERNSNLGYLAVGKQSAKGTAVTPAVYLPIYDADITTNPNFQKQNPIIGTKFANRSTLRGLREHNGSITVEGEPTTVGYIVDMFAKKGSTTGSDPYTHPFTLSKTADPNYYTLDISYVSHVKRYIGAGVSKIEESWEDNELRLKCDISCLKVWDGREVASVTGSGPYTITFKTEYDPSPTTGLVVGDTIQLFDVSVGSYIDCIVDTIENATDITVSENVSAGTAGDFVTLKPATSPSYSNKPTFEWANTEYRFGATAAAALSAAHTGLEQDTSLVLSHPFEDDAGSHRSGSHDPVSLPRMQGDYEFKTKKYFDTPEDLQYYSSMDKRACVVRHFAYSGALTYELRITLNNLTQANPEPKMKSEEILYSEIEFTGNYDTSDAQGMDIKVLNGTSSI